MNTFRYSTRALLVSLPFVCLVLASYVYSMGYTLALSFTKSSIFPNFSVWNLKQYYRLMRNAVWFTSLENLFNFTLLYLAVVLPLALFTACLLDRKPMFLKVYRSLLLLPFALAPVVAAVIWRFLLSPEEGLIAIYRYFTGYDAVFPLLSSVRYAWIGLVVVAVWNALGFTAVLLEGALKGVSHEIWQATKIEGIHPAYVYWYIVFPMIKGTIFLVVVLALLSCVRAFDIVVALTSGGPGNATMLPIVFVVNFISSKVSLASAASVLLLLITLAFLVPLLVFNRRGQKPQEYLF